MKFIFLSAILFAMPAFSADTTWKPLPGLPDAEGFAGAFGGVAGGALLVAGGTNFPDKMPWEGGSKVWYDSIYVLERPEGAWAKAGHLPRPNGYGVSITTSSGLVCIGGGDAVRHFRDVFRLRYAEGKITAEPLPPLPNACAFMAGALLGSTVYVAGGIETPVATTALETFWALDLDQLGRGWQALPSCPGPARILGCMGAHGGAVYLLSGAALKPGTDDKAAREWLRDAWRYTPGAGWLQVASLPRVSVAAPSPAPVRAGRLLVIGGDDGANVNFEPKAKHPGFPRDILTYDPVRDGWTREGEVPFSLVTTPAVEWLGRLVIPGGEDRPGKRSPEVWWKAF